MKFNLKTLGYFFLLAILALPVVLIFVLFFTMDDVYPDYTRQVPARKDIVGIWVLTTETVQEMKRLNVYKSANTSIEIRSDGTFKAIDLPDAAYSQSSFGWGFGKGTLASPSGKWSLGKEKFRPFHDVDEEEIQVWNLYLPFDNLSGYLAPQGYPILINQSPPYIIHIPFGDEDASEHIDFIKQ